MSWNTITKNGQKMYESCDGEVLGSTQDITTLENHRKEQSRLRRDKQYEEHLRFKDRQWDNEDRPYVTLSKEQQIFVIGMIIVGVGICIYRLFLYAN